MINKLILNNSYDFGDPATSLVKVHSRGVDHNWFVKQASQGVFHQEISQIKPKPGKTIIHVIALGDEESYGANRNCDAFSRVDNVTAHRSFKDIGHVFRHHQNTDPNKSVGDVLATAHNGPMSRVELLLALDNDKCRDEVQAINQGRDVPVSMGSSQAFDVCSYCGHKAPTAADHCRHIKEMLGLVLDNGQRIYMRNPNPKYFDISLVFKPADRVAYTLRKIASADQAVIGGHDLAEIYGLNRRHDSKTATMHALATLYKQVPMSLRKAPAPQPLKSQTVKELKKQAQIHGLDKLLAFLSENGWLMGASDFADVAGHPNPEAAEDAVDQWGDLDQLLNDHSEAKILSPVDYVSQIPLSDSAEEDLHRSCSMDRDPVHSRMLRITIIKPVQKVAGLTLNQADAQGLAGLYGQYKLAFATTNRDRPGVLAAVAATF